MNERTETVVNPAAFKKNEVLPNMTTIGRSSWSAVFSGTIIAIMGNVLLGMLGAGIGLASISASPSAGTLQGVGIGAIVWTVIVSIVSMYFGGWVTSRFAGMQRAVDGMLHGLITWGLTSILMITLLTGAIGAAISGGVGLLSGITRSSTQMLAALPPETRRQVQGAVTQGAQTGQQQMSQGAGQQLQAQAEDIGATAAKVTSGAAWGGFIVLLLGGVAAAMGGAAGRIRGPVQI